MALDMQEIFNVLRLPITAIVIVYIFLTAVYYLWYFFVVYTGKDPNCKAPLPPGTMGWPIVGETFKVLRKGSAFYSGGFRKYNTRLFKTHIFGRPTIRLYGSENLHTVLHGENTIVESNWPESTKNLIGDVLTLSTGDRHTTLKRHVSRAFTHEALEGYVDLALPSIQEAVDSWCTEDSVLAFDVAKRLFFETAVVVLCGVDRNNFKDSSAADTFLVFLKGFFTLPFDLPGTPYRKALLAKQKLLEELDEVVKRKSQLSSEEDTRDALRILMDNDKAIGGNNHVINDDANLKNEMLDILQAGFNTTSSAATTLIYHLSKNPGVIQSVRRELTESGLLDRDNVLTFDRVCDCKYLTNVVREALRMAPPIGGGFRKVLKTFELEGFQVPKGWWVLYSIRDTVNFSDSYTNRDQFDPDRFAPDRREDQKGGRYNYPIFGGGQRSCMGKQLALLLLRLLLVELARTCDIEPVAQGPVKFRDLPIPHPVDGYPVRFKRVDPTY